MNSLEHRNAIRKVVETDVHSCIRKQPLDVCDVCKKQSKEVMLDYDPYCLEIFNEFHLRSFCPECYINRYYDI